MFVLIALGIAATVASQLDSHRAPEPVLRFSLALAPFAMIATAAALLARTRFTDVSLILLAALLLLGCAMYTPDEFRISYVLVPVYGLFVTVPVLVVLTLVSWRRRTRSREQ